MLILSTPIQAINLQTKMIKNLLLVGIGGFIGAVLRYLLYMLMKNNQPYLTTLLINIIGSLIIGIIISVSIKNGDFQNNYKLFFATGICGGFTTFSAFSLENIQLLQEGKYLLSVGYILASVILGILACFIGFKYSA